MPVRHLEICKEQERELNRTCLLVPAEVVIRQASHKAELDSAARITLAWPGSIDSDGAANGRMIDDCAATDPIPSRLTHQRSERHWRAVGLGL